MNNDLISRSAVIAIIEKKRLMVGKHDLSTEYKLAGVQEEIENIPTVYDVDKVVERLQTELSSANDEKERCYRENQLQLDVAKGYAHGVWVSLEIVKSGGIE